MSLTSKKFNYNTMKRSIKMLLMGFLMMLISCNEPVTVVTDYVHADGSVTRAVLMKSTESKSAERFKISDLQIPLDDQWKIDDSFSVSEKGDTTWIRRAERNFRDVAELNLTYKADSGYNKNVIRHATFKKSFRWFNTEYRFSEVIDNKLFHGYPLKDFLNEKELEFFYSPDSIILSMQMGPDSLKYKAFGDSISAKTDKWMARNLVSEWIAEFSKLTEEKASGEMTYQSLKSRENIFAEIVERNDRQLDSLWKNGILLREFIGEENALKYKTEADSALSIVTNSFWVNFREYSVKISMPGKLIASNGFVDSSNIMLWPVKSDYFLTEPYEMWAESRIPNRWAWILSAIFLAFVLAGVLRRGIKKD